MPSDIIARFVAIGGSGPLSELTLYGPFDTAEEAAEWANRELSQTGDWWVAPVWKIEKEEEE